MLTAKQERFCQNLEARKMSQRAAYLDAYPASKKWTASSVDVKACNLAKEDKILLRREEIRNEQNDIIKAEAKWTRDKAYKTLTDLIEKAQSECEIKEELTSACVSAIINATKELNTIYAVGEKTEGSGMIEDILQAVRGIGND